MALAGFSSWLECQHLDTVGLLYGYQPLAIILRLTQTTQMLQGVFQTSWASAPQEVGIQDTLGSLVLAGASFACDTVGSAQEDVQANVD